MAATLIRLQGWAEQGGALAVTAGTTSVTKMQASYPGCTIQVYATGGTVLQSIYSNAAGTVSTANPFTTGASGAFGFYIADGRYDLRFSGTGIASPFTLSDVTVGPGNDARLGGYINIIAYGAVGDNSTDNSAALTSAQAAATAAGAALYIPAGTFRTVGGFAFTVPVEFAPGTSIIKHVGGSLSFSKSITADPSQHFASSSSLVVTFTGNKTLPDFYPQWWGVVADWNGSTGTDNSTLFQAMIDGVPDGSRIIITAGQGFTNSAGIGLNSQITLTNRKTLAFIGPTGLPQRYATQFVWLSAGGGTMFKLNYSQYIQFSGLAFFVPSGKVVDKFIDIDGYSAGVGISTNNVVNGCDFDASSQNNASFVAVDISRTALQNNEDMRIVNNAITCSGSFAAVRGSDDGVMAAGSTTLTSATAAWVAGNAGKRIRVQGAGAAGATLDTTITTVSSGTSLILAAPNASGSNVSNARMIIDQGYGIGIRNGASSNAKHQFYENNNVSQAAIAYDILGGSANIYGTGGGYSDIFIRSVGPSEPQEFVQLRPEGVVQMFKANGATTGVITMRSVRNSNEYQLADGWFDLSSGNIYMSMVDFVMPTPPAGGRVFKGTSSGGVLNWENSPNLGSGGSVGAKTMTQIGADTFTAGTFLIGFNAGMAFSPSLSGNGIAVGNYSLPSTTGSIRTAIGTVGVSDNLPATIPRLTPASAVDTVVIGSSQEIEITGLAPANIPSVTVFGTVGATLYYFFVVAKDAAGNSTLLSNNANAGTTTSANATLSATNFIRVAWPAVPGASTYDLYQRDNSNPNGQARIVSAGLVSPTYDVVANPAGAYTAITTLIPLAYNATSRIKLYAPIQPHSVLVANLGKPTAATGDVQVVTDGDGGLAWGATVVNSGAGATKYLVWYNGTNWTVAGK